MKRTLTPLALAACAIFGMYACLGLEKKDKDSGGGSLTWEFDLDVLNSVGGTSGTIITRQVQYECENKKAVADTEIDTSFYAVNGGSLYLWDDPKACYAQQLSGSSSTILGTWTASTNTDEVVIPAANKPQACTGGPDSSGEDLSALFEDGTVTYTVSSSKIHAKVSGTVCLADQISNEFADSGSGFTVVSTSCSSVELKSTQNQKTLTITSSFANNAMTVSYKSGATCTMSSVFPTPGVVPDCSKSQFGDADSTFSVCLATLDVFKPTLAKASAHENSTFQKRVEKSLRRFGVHP